MKNNKFVSVLMVCCLIQVAPTLASDANQPSRWQSIIGFFKPDPSLNRYKGQFYCPLDPSQRTVQQTVNGQVWNGYSKDNLKFQKSNAAFARNLCAVTAFLYGSATVASIALPPAHLQKPLLTGCMAGTSLMLGFNTFKLHSDAKKIEYYINTMDTKQQNNIPKELMTDDKNRLWQPRHEWRDYKSRNIGIVSAAFITAAAASSCSSNRR